MKPRVLTQAQRFHAAIVVPARRNTGLRHVVVPGWTSRGGVNGYSGALCGAHVDGGYLERWHFDPKTIGYKRCRAVWDRA